ANGERGELHRHARREQHSRHRHRHDDLRIGDPRRRPVRRAQAQVPVGGDEGAHEGPLARDEHEHPPPTGGEADALGGGARDSPRVPSLRRSRDGELAHASCGSFQCQPPSETRQRRAKIAASPILPITSPVKTIARQNARMGGHGDECGISTISENLPSATLDTAVSCPWSSTIAPSARLRASRSRSATSQFAYALVTVGMTAKLYSGGGELVAHSSVGPFHGSGPAGSPRR